MQTAQRWIKKGLGIGLMCLAGVGLATAQTGGQLRYVQVGPSGGKARNLQDPNALVVLDMKPGTLLAVYDQRGDWLKAEAPGGFKVWVYGQYVRTSSEPQMVEITNNDVMPRPLPSSGPESYALYPRLARGQKVRLIGRNDQSKALAEDWVQVYSPPGITAWVHSSETQPLTSDMEGATAWAEAVMQFQRSQRPAGAASGAAQPQTAGAPADGPPSTAAAAAAPIDSGDGVALLQAADQLRAQEALKPEPDYIAVCGAYAAVLEVVQTGSVAERARQGMQEIEAFVQAHQLKQDLEQERQRLDDEQTRREEAMKEATERRGAFDGRFDARGWMQVYERPYNPQPQYVLVFGGHSAAEIVCTSGRYNLADFVDFDIGIEGFELRAATAGTAETPAAPRVIDVSSLVVISGRYRGH